MVSFVAESETIHGYHKLGSVKKTLSETLAVILQIEYPS